MKRKTRNGAIVKKTKSRQNEKSNTSIDELDLEIDDGPVEFSTLYEPVVINNWEVYLKVSKDSFAKRAEYRGPLYTVTTSFNVLKTVNRGQFANILLVAKENEDNLLIVKSINKLKAKKLGHYDKVLNEKNILNGIRFPFTIYMVGQFKYQQYINFILPVVAGEDFYIYLQRNKKFAEPIARFYAAQIVLALEYLHNVRVVYRDLKLENILLDHLGYLKLVAFNLAKVVPENKRTYTLCGTPGYLAPEVISNEGYGPAVDWWSFGVLVFELCTGQSPFQAEDETISFERVTSGKFHIPFPLSYELKALLRGLVETDLTKRLGNLKNGVNDIKGHGWFSPVGWLTMLNQALSPPFIPQRRDLKLPIYYYQWVDQQNQQRKAEENEKQTRETVRFTRV